MFAHLLNVTNRTDHYATQNRQQRWTRNEDFCYWDYPHVELAGKTFGVVGLGNIGRRVAEIALAFGMKVKAMTSKPADALPTGIEKADLQELLAQPNAFITPHIAWATTEARTRLLQVVISNVQAFLAGTPQNVV